MSESGDRTELSHLKRARLDLFEVAVIAERLHGVADRRVDGTVGPLGHRVGDVESFEEQRTRLRRCDPRWRGSGQAPSRGESDCRHGRWPRSRRAECAPPRLPCDGICHDNGGRRAQGTEGPCRDAGLRRCHGRGGHLRDVPPEVATGRVVVVVGGEWSWWSAARWSWSALAMAKHAPGSDEVGVGGWRRRRRRGARRRGGRNLRRDGLGGRARAGVLFGHHHADGDGGPGRHQDSGAGQAPQADVGATPGLRGVGRRTDLIGQVLGSASVSWKRQRVGIRL